MPFIQAGLEAAEPVLVAVSRAKIDVIGEALGDDARSVTFADMTELGQNPARILPAGGSSSTTRSPPG